VSGGAANATTERFLTVDVTVWLVQHSEQRRMIGCLADLVQSECESFMVSLDETQRKKLAASHIWCDIIASVVAFTDEFELTVDAVQRDMSDQVGRFIGNVWYGFRKSRQTSTGSRPGQAERSTTWEAEDRKNGLVDTLLSKTVSALVLKILKAYTAQPKALLDAAKTHLQVLALMLCPDPAAHPLVWDQCLVPLLGGVVGDELRERFGALYALVSQPRDWGVMRARHHELQLSVIA